MDFSFKKGLLYVVSGPSGAGKTTLCEELIGFIPQTVHSISHTTRKPRAGEKDGQHYYFVTEKKFREIERANGFLEWATVHGNLYGTSKAELNRLYDEDKDVIIDVDTKGAKQVKASGIGDNFIFIIPPSMEELEKRLRGRDNSESEETISIRLFNAIEEIRSCGDYDFIVVNDNLGKALDAFKSIIVAERHKTKYFDLKLIKENFKIY